ncbi:MAG: ABC transporter ATP-binding protein [Bacteroidaceae bacterium]|nr:ABC transporter ATP-binding protein [Bacteroidaceae bacterium]
MDLTVTNVKKTFGTTVALDINNFVIHSGDLLGLVGNNGAGKTTLFRIILDLLKPDSGEATMSGELDGNMVSFVTSKCEDWKDFTGAYIDNGFLIDYLTPEEYFYFIGKVCGIEREVVDERLQRFEHFMNGEVLKQNKLIRDLSAGNQQKVGIIGAMINNPKMLILDEPFNFLDPSSQIAIKYILEQYNKEMGATILISSHNLTHTIDICSRITLLEHGVILKDYPKEYANLTAEIDAYFRGEVIDTPVASVEINSIEIDVDDPASGYVVEGQNPTELE